MPAWLAVVCALTAAVAGVLVKQLLAGSDESSKPLAALHGEGFDIRMPGTPERSEQPIPLPIVGPAKDLVGPTTAITYMSDGDDAAYSVSVMEGPTTVAFDLQQGLAGMATALGGSVRDRAQGRYRGRPAINARITGVADGKATSFVRIVRARKRVFVLQAIVRGKDVDRPPSAFRRVLASLRIRAAPRGAKRAEDPIVARKLPTAPAGDATAALADCRRQAAGRVVSDAVRRKVSEVCAGAAGKNAVAIGDATLAACLAVAQETGELERCGFEIVSPE